MVAAREADTKHRKDIREAFGEFISTGKEIEKKIEDTTRQLPVQDKNIWDNEVALYLDMNLGESYSVRFHDPTGIIPVACRELTMIDKDYGGIYTSGYLGWSNLAINSLIDRALPMSQVY